MILSRRHFVAGTTLAAASLALPALAANEPQRIASELANGIADLPGIVMLGAASPDVTLYEFFDYNCPFCRKAAAELPALLAGDRDLGYGLVNFAVLGAPSIAATKVALAFAENRPASDYLAFHLALFKLRGQVDGDRAIAVAVAQGGKTQALIERANSDEIGKRALDTVLFGDSIGLQATPSYLSGVESIAGYVSLEEKRALIANLRKCETMRC